MSSVNEKVILGSNDHAKKLSIRLMDLLREEELVDVILVADGQLFPAHRLILSAFSPSFRKMFKQMLVNQQAYVFMNGISKETMAHLINYMYNGEVELHRESLADLIENAKSLEIDGISDELYCQLFGQQQSAQNGSIHPEIQYQTSHINRFQNSNSTRNKTLPVSTLDPSQHSHADDIAVHGNGIDYNDSDGSFYDAVDGYYGHDSEIETGNFDNSMDQVFDPQNLSWDETYNDDYDQFDGNELKTSGGSTAKRAKRANTDNDASEHNVISDIRVNDNGVENLFHAHQKFIKHGKRNKTGQQRWKCTKVASQKCRAAASTMDVNGVTMMKTLVAEHTHVD